jgi:probable F420-dependent oxidoreductase
MEYGVVIPSQGRFGDAGAIRAFVAAAEDLDFHTAWFGDHVVVPGYAAHISPPNWYDALSCCLVGAGATTRLRFGTDVLVLPYRNPVVLASEWATADQLSDGRLTLAGGIGYIRGEFAAVGAPPYEQRGRVTTEYLRALRTLWEADGAVSFTGEHVAFEDVHPGPAPRQRPMPLWVGGNGPAAIARAARHGNGWHPLFPTPEQYAAARDEILSIRADAGNDEPFAFAMSCPGTRVELDDDPPQRTGPSGYGDVHIPEEYGYAPAFPAAADGRLRFVGSPEQLADDVRAYRDAGVQHLALRFWTTDPEATVDDVVAQMVRWQQLVAPLV